MNKTPNNTPDKRPRHYAAEILLLFPEHREAAILDAPAMYQSIIRQHVTSNEILSEEPQIQRLAEEVVNLSCQTQRRQRLQATQDHRPILYARVYELAIKLWDEKKEHERA